MRSRSGPHACVPGMYGGFRTLSPPIRLVPPESYVFVGFRVQDTERIGFITGCIFYIPKRGVVRDPGHPDDLQEATVGWQLPAEATVRAVGVAPGVAGRSPDGSCARGCCGCTGTPAHLRRLCWTSWPCKALRTCRRPRRGVGGSDCRLSSIPPNSNHCCPIPVPGRANPLVFGLIYVNKIDGAGITSMIMEKGECEVSSWIQRSLHNRKL